MCDGYGYERDGEYDRRVDTEKNSQVDMNIVDSVVVFLV